MKRKSFLYCVRLAKVEKFYIMFKYGMDGIVKRKEKANREI